MAAVWKKLQYEITVSAPIAKTGDALTIINDASDAITEIDTDVLADSDTKIPTSKAVKTAIQVGSTSGLFELDIGGDLEPITDELADEYYELDVNDDIQPKAAA